MKLFTPGWVEFEESVIDLLWLIILAGIIGICTPIICYYRLRELRNDDYRQNYN